MSRSKKAGHRYRPHWYHSHRHHPHPHRHQSHNRLSLLIVGLAAALLIAALGTASELIPDAALTPGASPRNLAPAWPHLLGTDWLGRDLAARTVAGLWLSARLGLVVAALSTVVAAALALASTLGPRWCDVLVRAIVDATLSIPQVILALLLSFAVGGGIPGIVLALSLTLWPSLCRLLRSRILAVSASDYIAQSAARGHGQAWIAWHHVLPAIVPHLVVGTVVQFPHAIIHESTLTFLGFGVEPTTPSLGIILSEGIRYLSAGQWWAVAGPIGALVVVTLLFERLGQLSRLVLSPATRQQ